MTAHASEAGHFKSAALVSTNWLDTPSMEKVLEDGDLDFRELKTGKIDVYVVIPVEELENYSRLLRLLVTLAMRAMLGTKGKSRCLFLLDEFFALGKLEVMLKAFAAGRSAGIRCFPFVQDMGQLETLYQKPGMRSFFANSSLHLFFAVNDDETLKHISERLGEVTVEDLGLPPHEARAAFIPQHLLDRAARQAIS